MAVQGIDVSNLQGEFNWAAWHGKIGFAAVKATEGPVSGRPPFFDGWFQRNWQQAWSLNGAGRLVRIAYHFARPSGDPGDPVAQADQLTSYVRRYGLEPGDHFALDLEVNGGLAPDRVAAWAKEFCYRVNATTPHARCLVYTYPAFAAAGNCTGLEPWHLWLADYATEPSVPHPWAEWKMWQYTDTGLDRDVFNGDEQELLDFFRMPASRRG